MAANDGYVICASVGCSFEFGTYPIGLDPIGQRRPCPLCGGLTRDIRHPLGGEITTRADMHIDGGQHVAVNPDRRIGANAGRKRQRVLRRLIGKQSQFDPRADQG